MPFFRIQIRGDIFQPAFNFLSRSKGFGTPGCETALVCYKASVHKRRLRVSFHYQRTLYLAPLNIAVSTASTNTLLWAVIMLQFQFRFYIRAVLLGAVNEWCINTDGEGSGRRPGISRLWGLRVYIGIAFSPYIFAGLVSETNSNEEGIERLKLLF